MAKKLLKWFADLFGNRHHYKFAEDVSDKLKPDTLYHIGWVGRLLLAGGYGLSMRLQKIEHTLQIRIPLPPKEIPKNVMFLL
jgi:hypothetical protein